MAATRWVRRSSLRLLVLLSLVATVFVVTPVVPAEEEQTGSAWTTVQQSAYEASGPRHESPAACSGGGPAAGGGMDAFLKPTIVLVKRGDNGTVIGGGPFNLPFLTTDISEGDTVKVLEMELTNDSGCDISNASLWVGMYEDGSGTPGTSVAGPFLVASGVSISQGQTLTFNPNTTFTVGPTAHDIGDDLAGGGDPDGEQFAITGIVDAGHGDNGLKDFDKCGAAGSLHNGEVDGTGCSVYNILLNLNDPRITVKKKAFIWNGKNPKVFVKNGQVKVHGTYLVDGVSIVEPGQTVFYLYRVVNIGPINDLVPGLLADDQCSPITQATDGALIGDDGNDGEMDIGEQWYFLCHRSYGLGGNPSKVVQNNASFIFDDRNGNETDSAVDDFTVIVGYTCFGELATIVGTNGDDVIDGTGAKDVIYAKKGNDEIDGKAGGDLICAGGGDDVVQGGNGKDKINGEGGDDDLSGGPKNDVIKGDKGNDLLKGQGGKDNLDGGPGTDTANGGPGSDTCTAEIKKSC